MVDPTVEPQKRTGVEDNYQLMSTVINSPADIIIFALDRNYNYLVFNDKHRQEMRAIWNAEIEAGMNMLALMTHTELRAAAQRSFDRVLAGEAFTEIQYQPGPEIYYELIWNPIKNAGGEITGLTAFIRDISEQKRAAEAVKESERRYRASQNAAHLGSWEWKIASDQLTWSDEMFVIFDKDPQNFIPTNQAVFDAMLEADKPAAIAAVEAAITHGIPFHSEYRILDRSQRIQWVESSGEVTFNEQKQPAYAAGTVQDITKRKQAEEVLRKTQLLLNESQRITKSGGWEFDLLTRKVTWTDEVYRIYGVSKEFDPSSADQDIQFYAPADQEIINNAFRLAVEQGIPYDLELRLNPAQGEKIWVRTAGQAERQEGKIVRIFGNILDITERKQAEEALRGTRDYLENLINHANAAIITWDSALRITRFNYAFEHLTGYAAPEIIGQGLHFLFPVKSREKSLSKIARTFSGENWESVEIPIQCSNGEIRIVLWNSANLYAPDGVTLIATIAQGQDITARKKAEEQLNVQLAELRRWNDATLEREGRILELKREVNQLLAQTGQAPRHPSAAGENPAEE